MDISVESVLGVVISLVFGALFGSFSTMASYRMPRGEEMVFTPSHCPLCNHRLGVRDLVPLLSWVFSGGKCRHCKAKVSCRYPLTELVLSLVFVLVYLQMGFSLLGLSFFALAVCLVIMIVVDLEHKIIPDQLQLALIPIGLLYRYAMDSELVEYFSGAVLGLFIALSLRYGFWLWKKREGLGMGDVKFFAVAGVFLGVESFVPFMLLSGVFGVVTAWLWKSGGGGEEFPFGPSLAISLFVCLMFPQYTVELIFLH